MLKEYSSCRSQEKCAHMSIWLKNISVWHMSECQNHRFICIIHLHLHAKVKPRYSKSVWGVETSLDRQRGKGTTGRALAETGGSKWAEINVTWNISIFGMLRMCYFFHFWPERGSSAKICLVKIRCFKILGVLVEWCILNQTWRVMRIHVLVLSCVTSEIDRNQWRQSTRNLTRSKLCQEVIFWTYRYSQKYETKKMC